MAEEPDRPASAPASFRARLAGWLRRQSGGRFRRSSRCSRRLAIGLYFVLVQAPPVWPFLTTGRIYVESPGVYTRERLVNDRYSQDFWLKSQLTLLDQSKDLVRQYRLSRLQAGAATTGDAAPEPERVVLAFQDELLLRAAIRDKIRQMILENLLDDRHDLTGNSIYGLKFDTAVVPGTNTYARPYVVVRIEAETLPDGKGPGDVPGGSGQRQQRRDRRRVCGDAAAVQRLAAERGEPAERLPGAGGEGRGLRRRGRAEAGGFGRRRGGEGGDVRGRGDGDGEPGFGGAAGTAGARGRWLEQINRARILSALRNVLGVEAREVTFRPGRRAGRSARSAFRSPGAGSSRSRWRSPGARWRRLDLRRAVQSFG